MTSAKFLVRAILDLEFFRVGVGGLFHQLHRILGPMNFNSWNSGPLLYESESQASKLPAQKEVEHPELHIADLDAQFIDFVSQMRRFGPPQIMSFGRQIQNARKTIDVSCRFAHF